MRRRAWTDFCRRGLRDNNGKQLWSMFKKSRGGMLSDDAKSLEELQVMDENDFKASEMFGAAHILSTHIAAPLSMYIPDRFTGTEDVQIEDLTDEELVKF